MQGTKSKKWKVLIADDESRICRLIQALIPWDELDLELASAVGNGLEAIEFLKNNRADILITDARMPECDGIELIKWCHDMKLDMKYIIISGFRYFEYAHGAIQYGVDSYLLKPINQEELIETLKSIISKLEEKSEYKNEELPEKLDINRDKMRRHFISSYIFDGKNFVDRDIRSVDYINEEYQMNFSDGIYRAVFVKLDDTKESEYKLDAFLQRIKEAAESRWSDYLSENIGCAVHSGVIFFVNYKESDEEKFREDINALLDEIEKMTDMLDGIRITIGIGKREESLKDIRSCMVTAADAIKFRLYLPHVPIIYYENYSYKLIPASKIWTHERDELLDNYMRSGNEKGIQKLVFDLKLEIHQEKDLSPVVIYEIVGLIFERTLRIFSEICSETDIKKSDIVEKYLEDLDNMGTVDSIAVCLERLVLQIMEAMDNELKQKEVQPIRLIRRFIDEHYAENISLDDVADEVQLSKNYVSAIFKKETGVNFLDFLTSKRINEAEKLLRKSRLTISEIAERVGYNDVKYFSKLCKKNLGMNPSEYRKLYS